MAAFPVSLEEGGKSKAKQLETFLINALKRRGYVLANIKMGDMMKNQAWQTS